MLTPSGRPKKSSILAVISSCAVGIVTSVVPVLPVSSAFPSSCDAFVVSFAASFSNLAITTSGSTRRLRLLASYFNSVTAAYSPIRWDSSSVRSGISLPQAVMDNIIAHNKAPHTIFLLRPVIVRSFSSFLSVASLIAFLFQYNIDSGNYKSNYAYHEEKYGLLQDRCAPVII